MPDLGIFGYNVIYNLLSFAVAAMGAASIFFFFKPRISPKYATAMVVTGLVTTIAFYHYWMIRDSFAASYSLTAEGVYTFNELKPFNDFYRYADWLLTVPLLVVELIFVMALAKAETKKYLVLLVPAVLLMIATGYPGEVEISKLASGQEASVAAIWAWFTVSMIFFVIILGILFIKLSDAISRQPREVQGLFNLARIVLLITWCFYPIAYVIGALGGKTAAGVIGLQVGYTLADILAKAGFGLIIYTIARRKSELEREQPGSGEALTA